MTRSASLSDSVDVDVVSRLGDPNAPRRCGSCDDDARYYVYDDDEVSRYVCPEHLDAAVRDAGGDPEAVTLGGGHARRNGRPRGGSE